MSEDPEANPTTKSILFIGLNSTALRSTFKYLERRDFKFRHSLTLQQGIDMLGVEHVDVIFLSVNLPNTFAHKVIPMLQSTFNVTVVIYSERGDNSSVMLLNSIGHEHRISPPVNGPKVVFKVQSLSKTDALSHLKFQTRAPSEETGTTTVIHNSNDRSQEILIQKGQRGQLHSAVESGPKSKMHSAVQGSTKGPVSSGQSGSNKPLPKSDFSYSAKPVAPQGLPRFPLRSVAVPNEVDHDQHRVHPPLELASETLGVSINPVLLPLGFLSSDRRDLMAAAQFSAHAFSSVATTHQKVTRTRHVGAVTIATERFKGYLLIAVGDQTTVTEDMIQIIKTNFYSYLKDKGETIDPNKPEFDVTIGQIEFPVWADELAEFLVFGKSGNDQLAIAFISGADAIPVLAPAHSEMLAVSCKDVRVGTLLDFDLYLYLPANDRFILYATKDGHVDEKQLQRLNQNGVHHFHIREKQARAFQVYCGRHFIQAHLRASRIVIDSEREIAS